MNTRMKSVTLQGLVLLACLVTCCSIVSKRCVCLTKKNRENRLIVDIRERPPRPYCSSYEVIAVLSTGGSSCLNPESSFTKGIVRTFRKRKAEETNTEKLHHMDRETTTPSSTTTNKTSTTSLRRSAAN